MAEALSLKDAISKEELRELLRPSDLKAWGILIVNLAIIAGAFAMAIVWPNPLTVILGILLLGGRQLGLAVILHDCAHHAFFKSRKVNEMIGHWLCGGSTNVSLFAYRAYHLKHHQHAGTKKDPDIVLVHNYPVPRDSLRRKFFRDLTGQTGVRDLIRDLKKFSLPKNLPWLVFHLTLFGILFAVGAPLAYAMWWVAELFLYPAITRLRNIGEHGVASNRASIEPRDNTNTTLANPIERLFVAPNYVNFHCEHHHFAAVPPYNLPRLHRMLRDRGYFEQHNCVTRGYRNVIHRAIRPEPQAVAA
ncbi:MAG: fatty acid desaturase family protein [Parasphingopyxis sp.]|uniref:fatty acid desaturase family protein n=1 Tax=Parasphingopyxis sp. TaxID=1920299 RepID=UPI0032EB8332